MNKKDVLQYFDGSARKVADALGLSVQYVHQWPERVPFKQACRIEDLTGGQLKVFASEYLK